MNVIRRMIIGESFADWCRVEVIIKNWRHSKFGADCVKSLWSTNVGFIILFNDGYHVINFGVKYSVVIVFSFPLRSNRVEGANLIWHDQSQVPLLSKVGKESLRDTSFTQPPGTENKGPRVLWGGVLMCPVLPVINISQSTTKPRLDTGPCIAPPPPVKLRLLKLLPWCLCRCDVGQMDIRLQSIIVFFYLV